MWCFHYTVLNHYPDGVEELGGINLGQFLEVQLFLEVGSGDGGYVADAGPTGYHNWRVKLGSGMKLN